VITGVDLDHVAVAAEQAADAWPRYVGQLGGTWQGGAPDPGFIWGQVRFANGMTLEVLEPHRLEENDFLRRFLDRNGPGPHHLTFKVPDLVAALPVVEAAGYRPVSVNVANEGWKEAFLHPKDGPGVVIQLAESSGEWESPPPPELPEVRALRASSLDRVTHAVADMDEGLRLFEGLLGGSILDAGDGDQERWVELGWTGPGRVRLVTPTGDSGPLRDWLGDRAGRVHHLAFTVPGLAEPEEIAPADNLGVRLCLT
jgi:methylmalonyl-CoA/ethylmalonyl-CoA epimerase